MTKILLVGFGNKSLNGCYNLDSINHTEGNGYQTYQAKIDEAAATIVNIDTTLSAKDYLSILNAYKLGIPIYAVGQEELPDSVFFYDKVIHKYNSLAEAIEFI